MTGGAQMVATHLANSAGAVPGWLEHLRDGVLRAWQASDGGDGEVVHDAGAHTEPAREQRGAAHRADGRTHVKIREADPLRS